MLPLDYWEPLYRNGNAFYAYLEPEEFYILSVQRTNPSASWIFGRNGSL